MKRLYLTAIVDLETGELFIRNGYVALDNDIRARALRWFRSHGVKLGTTRELVMYDMTWRITYGMGEPTTNDILNQARWLRHLTEETEA